MSSPAGCEDHDANAGTVEVYPVFLRTLQCISYVEAKQAPSGSVKLQDAPTSSAKSVRLPAEKQRTNSLRAVPFAIVVLTTQLVMDLPE